MAVRRRPMISLAAATGLIEALEAAGQDPAEVLRSVGLDRQSFADPHGIIPTADFARILEEAAPGHRRRVLRPALRRALSPQERGARGVRRAELADVRGRLPERRPLFEDPQLGGRDFVRAGREVGVPPTPAGRPARREPATAQRIQPGRGTRHDSPDGGLRLVPGRGAVRPQGPAPTPPSRFASSEPLSRTATRPTRSSSSTSSVNARSRRPTRGSIRSSGSTSRGSWRRCRGRTTFWPRSGGRSARP